MNLGIYTKVLGQTEELKYAVPAIHSGIESGDLTDASIFYDSAGPHPFKINCGCFNTTDLWNFTGCLVITSLEATRTAINIVNKFSMVFYYNWEDITSTIGLIGVVNNPRIKTVCRSSEDAQELYRLTGIKAKAIVNNFNLVEMAQVEDNE